MKTLYQIKTNSQAFAENCVQHEKLRLSVLTPSLVRLEWSEKKRFTDKPSQTVMCRSFCKVPFVKQNTEDGFYIETETLIISYAKAPSLREAVKITLKNPCANWDVINGLKDSWRYGDELHPLPGTARTLDNSEGEVPLEDGIISRDGFAVLDDSKTCLINEDGTVEPRPEKNAIDVYFFAYGHDYKACLADFFRLTGKPPLLPRYALGNWWSRYHKYTQKEYVDLMDEFKAQGIPLSVAVIDMDWHITQIEKDIGSGWTGYTWNTELFPDHKKFLSDLHGRGLKTSLNVHPAEGIGRNEAEYKNMADALGVPSDGKTIPFDITNPEFIEAYLEVLHYPLENDGVDFWWLDWQQGTKTAVEGLDPLWLLNHYHYLDNAKNKKRPLILSRYSGPGSQRYPVGFSGDTVISWKSLAFQPYFTASASNIGYGWWSHDIGGHMLGSYDEELQVRWAQFGVFSPVMRLHSSSSRFNHKEPWKYDPTASVAVRRYMRLRHQMIPYLYTMNERFSRTGEPLVEPLYYEYPETSEAYSKPNEYFFGSELICAPITVPQSTDLKLAPVEVWLPEGTWTDIFTGVTYKGGRTLTMYRPLSDIPVLLKEAGILPLASENSIEKNEALPSELEIFISLAKADAEKTNSFTLYEDDGESFSFTEGKSALTEFVFASGKKNSFKIKAAKGDASLLPQTRAYTLHFLNANQPEAVTVLQNGGKQNLPFSYDRLFRKLSVKIDVQTDTGAEISFEQTADERESKWVRSERCAAMLDKAQIDFVQKEQLFEIIQKSEANPLAVCRQLLLRKEDEKMIEALIELLENV